MPRRAGGAPALCSRAALCSPAPGRSRLRAGGLTKGLLCPGKAQRWALSKAANNYVLPVRTCEKFHGSKKKMEEGEGEEAPSIIPNKTWHLSAEGLSQKLPGHCRAEGCSLPREPIGSAAGSQRFPSCRISPSLEAALGDRAAAPTPGAVPQPWPRAPGSKRLWEQQRSHPAFKAVTYPS